MLDRFYLWIALVALRRMSNGRAEDFRRTLNRAYLFRDSGGSWEDFH